jgi:Flp pilus assembly protein TadD
MNVTKQASADALYGVGHWLLEQERADDAMHVFRTMLVLAPTDERAWLGLGACHEKTNEPAKAARLYALAPQACSGSVRLAVALGRVLQKLDRDADAHDAFAKAAELAEATGDVQLATLVAMEARGA